MGAPQRSDLNSSQWVDEIFGNDFTKSENKNKTKSIVHNYGARIQKEAAHQSQVLSRPLYDLSKKVETGGPVAGALIDLRVKVEELDPAKIDFEPGWMGRILGHFPGVGTPLKRYFSKFESTQAVIFSILRSLEEGKLGLERDNVSLTEDQAKMSQVCERLESVIAIGQGYAQKIEQNLKSENCPVGSEKHRFLTEDVLFPLQQRIVDLQQQLLINQQGILATDLIVRNNRDLIHGVDRALHVTVGALRIGVMVAFALENQRISLEKIQTVSAVTSNLMLGTAQRLRMSGVQIQEQTAHAQLNMDSLKGALKEINQAVDDISQYRSKALPKISQTVKELSQMTKEAQKSISALKNQSQGAEVLDLTFLE